MRTVLQALADIKSTRVATGAGRRRPARQLRRFSPIFPVRSLAAALDHYSALGFDASAYDGGHHYGFADRDGTGLHLSAEPDHDPAHAASTYLYVADADALFEEWTRPGIGGRTEPVGPTPYGLREGTHTDPDGNLIRFGSPLEE
jgi:hypothetical protein